MREILFRGKRIDNGEWVYGNYVYRPKLLGEHYIVTYNAGGSNMWFLVDPATVGQYTGLNANGKKIFEGDIVREVWGELVYPTRLVVFMDSKRRGWFPFACGDGCGCCEQEVWEETHAEVIGNIHDNPELLEGGADNV